MLFSHVFINFSLPLYALIDIRAHTRWVAQTLTLGELKTFVLNGLTSPKCIDICTLSSILKWLLNRNLVPKLRVLIPYFFFQLTVCSTNIFIILFLTFSTNLIILSLYPPPLVHAAPCEYPQLRPPNDLDTEGPALAAPSCVVVYFWAHNAAILLSFSSNFVHNDWTNVFVLLIPSCNRTMRSACSSDNLDECASNMMAIIKSIH